MAYLKQKDVKALREIAKVGDRVGYPFESKKDFDLWFETWVKDPIEEIIGGE